MTRDIISRYLRQHLDAHGPPRLVGCLVYRHSVNSSQVLHALGLRVPVPAHSSQLHSCQLWPAHLILINNMEAELRSSCIYSACLRSSVTTLHQFCAEQIRVICPNPLHESDSHNVRRSIRRLFLHVLAILRSQILGDAPRPENVYVTSGVASFEPSGWGSGTLGPTTTK